MCAKSLNVRYFREDSPIHAQALIRLVMCGRLNDIAICQAQKMIKKVNFDDTVHLHLHRLTIGDNPSCTIGTPVALSWDAVDHDTASLKDTISKQKARYSTAAVDRSRKRAKHERVPQGPPIRTLNFYQRQEKLKQAGYSLDEIIQAERDTNTARRQRTITLQSYKPQMLAKTTQGALNRIVLGKGSRREKKKLVKKWHQTYGYTSR